jgi:hypothetical protein
MDFISNAFRRLKKIVTLRHKALLMEEVKGQLAHLAEIRALMERSNRYLSLSGLSGVWAGCCALAGALAIYMYLDVTPFSGEARYYEKAMQANRWGLDYREAFLLIGSMVLMLAIVGGLINGSKYTVGDVAQLGIAEVALGLLGVFFIGHGLELWTFGFGFLHIAYGIWMYYRYDRL